MFSSWSEKKYRGFPAKILDSPYLPVLPTFINMNAGPGKLYVPRFLNNRRWWPRDLRPSLPQRRHCIPYSDSCGSLDSEWCSTFRRPLGEIARAGPRLEGTEEAIEGIAESMVGRVRDSPAFFSYFHRELKAGVILSTQNPLQRRKERWSAI